MLGIPTVQDRVIQQAIAQILTAHYDPTFSEYSYGFRTGHSAHDAIKQSTACPEGGCRFIVEMDLAKFFDTVNHDRLMSRLEKDCADKPLLKLIRRYLRTGIMSDGLVEAREEGTPQGSPLSPILSLIVLDELDKFLEKRGLRSVGTRMIATYTCNRVSRANVRWQRQRNSSRRRSSCGLTVIRAASFALEGRNFSVTRFGAGNQSHTRKASTD